MPFGQAPGQGFNSPVNPRIVTTVIQSTGAQIWYSPTRGAGNMIASVAAAGGFDQYGNAYLAGQTSYSGTLAIQTNSGTISFKTATSQAGPWNAAFAQVGSANNTDLSFFSSRYIVSQEPHIMDQFAFAQNPASLGTPEVWHNIALQNSCTAGTDVNGTTYTPAIALTSQGDIKLKGVVVAPAGGLASGTTWGVTPSASYTPTTNVPTCLISNGTRGTLAHVYVRPNGNLQFDNALGAGTSMWIDCTLFIQGV